LAARAIAARTLDAIQPFHRKNLIETNADSPVNILAAFTRAANGRLPVAHNFGVAR